MVAVGLILVLLLILYGVTLQTIPNGSSHYFMIDVGETQIVLNNWGTLHATGYPLYVIIGNLLTEVLVVLGVAPLTAPAIVSTIWGLLTLALIGALSIHLTRRVWLAAGLVLLFGLTRTVWIHHVVAEIYTFGLLLQIGLLALALWGKPSISRVYWLALLGGVAVAHHRATAMMIPALVYAVWPVLWANRRQLPRILFISLLLGLVGFVQYGYLYLRAQAGADWVYGQPGTLAGLWDEFIGREASRFIGPPGTFDALITNFELVTSTVIRDLTLPGVLLGIAGLVMAIRQPDQRRSGITFALMALVAYGFHVAWYSDVLSALILLVTVALAFGWLFLADWLLTVVRSDAKRVRLAQMGIISLTLAGALFLLAFNWPFIVTHTTDRTGLETIELLEAAPEDATVMLAWGPRYFAATVGQLFLDRLDHIRLVDDKADFRSVDQPLVTAEFTLFNQPLNWWRDRLGSDVYLYAAAPRLVTLATSPRLAEDTPTGITVAEAQVTCSAEEVILDVVWQTSERPEDDLSVYVHGLDAGGQIIAQADQRAPVYGWRPLTDWLPGEQVRDIYPLTSPDDSHLERIRYGMYRVLPEGGFENVSSYEVMVNCQ